MKVTVKKIFNVILILTMIVGTNSIYAKSDNVGYSRNVQTKINLVQRAKNVKRKSIRTTSQENINKMIVEYTMNKSISPEELESYGLFVLESEEPSVSSSIMSIGQEADVNMSTPSILYNSSNDTWIVTGGGYWKNDNWKGHFNNAFWGTYREMGGKDGYGVSFTQINDPSKFTFLRGTLYIHDGNGWQEDSNTRMVIVKQDLVIDFRIK